MKRTIILLVLVLTTCYSCIGFAHDTRGYEFKNFENTPAYDLANAVKGNDVDKIREIVKADSSIINYQEPKRGKTLLMVAIANQKDAAFETLLELGANANIFDKRKTSALLQVCSVGNTLGAKSVYYAQKLVEHGADVNLVAPFAEGDSLRNTPLMAAANEHTDAYNIELIRLLVKNGADVNYRKLKKYSILANSILSGDFRAAYVLLQLGADFKSPIYYRFNANTQQYDMPVDIKEAITNYRGPELNKNRGYKEKILNFIGSR